jgi:hypothetical protein
MFLNIIQGKHAGNQIELEQNVLYTISNKFGDDLFIDPGFTDYTSCKFKLENNSVIFLI